MAVAQADRSNFLGAVCVAIAVMLFSLQDTAIKWISDGYPLHQIVLFRGGIAIILTLAILVPLDGGYRRLRTRRPGLHLLRGAMLVIGNLTFFTSLASLPLPLAVSVFFSAPLIATLLAIPILGERPAPRKLALIALGFVGVLLIVRPTGADFRPVMLLPLVSACAYASMQLMTRKLAATEPASTLAVYIHLMFILSAVAMGLIVGDGRFAVGDNPSVQFLLRAWVWPQGDDWLFICGIGVLNTGAGYLISQGYRLAEVSRVAPFEYIAVPMSVVWGVILWGHWPDTLALSGIALILSAGVMVARYGARR